ncbi:MAG: LamG-like jellyroll fold domain-containing protein [Verrucomicrobiota bacterium]
MKPISFNHIAKDEQEWVDDYIDGTITEQAFEALQDRMMEKPELRAVMRRYLALDNTLQNEASGAEASEQGAASWLAQDSAFESETLVEKKVIKFPSLVPLAAAAALAFLLGSVWMHWQSSTVSPAESDLSQYSENEPSAQGFAVIDRLLNVNWVDAQSSWGEGDTLGVEVFRIASGIAEIQFFSGAVMTVEGPAEISLKSAWEAFCEEGSIRMKVPPAARGFVLHGPSTEIVDLGTEFGLEVRDGKGHVEVFDGEIEVRHQDEETRLVESGGAWGLPADGESVAVQAGEVEFPDADRLGAELRQQRRSDFQKWESHREALARDERLIAYYTFDREAGQNLVPNITEPRHTEFDGAVVMAEEVTGRWPGMKSALEFRRPGSRVRVNIPGEFPAFTFMCWVRIDSLDRWYNALFMGDGYETGEPHWQIRNDGKMMLSVMVDDTKPNPKSLKDAGFHRVYFSPPMWDLSMSGQWMHLASVFDPAKREVCHYVNGELIHRQEIEESFFIDQLRIGNGEIGNWGEPFREDPTFAIRNLNGRMDELALFRAALGEEEIAGLFERSRAGRH